MHAFHKLKFPVEVCNILHSKLLREVVILIYNYFSSTLFWLSNVECILSCKAN